LRKGELDAGGTGEFAQTHSALARTAVLTRLGLASTTPSITTCVTKPGSRKVRDAPVIAPLLLVGRPKYPGRDELIAIAAGQVVGNAGKEAGEAKHKCKTFGRTVPVKKEHERPRSLIHALLDNDPNDDAADGVSVGISASPKVSDLRWCWSA
jgi:hypothetical protein